MRAKQGSAQAIHSINIVLVDGMFDMLPQLLLLWGLRSLLVMGRREGVAVRISPQLLARTINHVENTYVDLVLAARTQCGLGHAQGRALVRENIEHSLPAAATHRNAP
jgi:hypothetical protein